MDLEFVSDLSTGPDEKTCVTTQSNSDSKVEPCRLVEDLTPNYDIYGICQYQECDTQTSTTCQFPFKYVQFRI